MVSGLGAVNMMRGRSQHDALDALAVGLGRRKVNWVLDADIRGFFDTISHKWMVRFIEHRIADRRIINRSKPPALPGRHAKFDNFGKIIKPHAREPLKAHGKEMPVEK